MGWKRTRFRTKFCIYIYTKRINVNIYTRIKLRSINSFFFSFCFDKQKRKRRKRKNNFEVGYINLTRVAFFRTLDDDDKGHSLIGKMSVQIILALVNS